MLQSPVEKIGVKRRNSSAAFESLEVEFLGSGEIGRKVDEKHVNLGFRKSENSFRNKLS